MQIGRRIYYELSTGNIIVDVGERSGDVVETTEEQDFESYVALAERVRSTVGVIQLEYGQYADQFNNSYGYHIDITTNQIIFELSPPDASLEQTKAAKLTQLDGQCTQTILSGFVSSALGSPHTYGFDYQAQIRFAGKLAKLNDPTSDETSVLWNTRESGYVEHTVAQFRQVFADGEAWTVTNMSKYFTLKYYVTIATTVEEVNSIIWE